MNAKPISVVNNITNRELAKVIFNPISDNKKMAGGMMIIDKPKHRKTLSILEISLGQKAKPSAIPGRNPAIKLPNII